MKKDFVYIESNSLSPYFNLALEYYLTTEKAFEDETVLLFWRTEPTLVVGRYQNTMEEINHKYAEEQGINIVRRLSGGGTVYYDQGGWQYSFITKADGKGISFEKYMKPVISALADMGVEAEFTGRNDILVSGRKVSGTAQYKHNGFTVHHGTLLYDVDLEEMVRSTTVNEYKIVSKGIKSVRERVTNISEHMETPVSMEVFRDNMVESIGGKDCKRYVLNEVDVDRINAIAGEKFDNWECKFGRNPQCSIVKKGHFDGGNLELHFDISKGIIQDIAVYGDFFAEIDKDAIERMLRGCEFEKKSIKERLSYMELEKRIYKISVEDIAELLSIDADQ